MEAPSPTILLVDDDNVFNTLNRKMLSLVGVNEVKVCLNGQQALDYLLSTTNPTNGQQNVVPCLVFLDINMPIMNGWEFLDEFKNLEVFHSLPMRIVVLTASKNPDDERMARGNPFVAEFIVKPINRVRLQEVISTFCNRKVSV